VSQPAASSSVRYSRTQLLIILLTPVLVVISSSALYLSGWLIPDDRSNNGILLDPVLSVTDFGLPEIVITQDRQWQLIQFSPQCNENCIEKAYEQRQMHVALGKLQTRIQRVLLTTSDVDSALGDEYPNLLVKSFNPAALTNNVTARIPMSHLSQNTIFVVDPFGNIMLYFINEHDYKAQLKDLKKLLKLSTIG
jgi:hypothetical protein